MDRYDPAFAPVRHRRRWLKKPVSRTEWRKNHAKATKRTKHGGRGRKYGIKGRKHTARR